MVCCFIGDGDISKSENSLFRLAALFKYEDVCRMYIGADGVFFRKTVGFIQRTFDFSEIEPICVKSRDEKIENRSLAMIKRDEWMVENSDLVVCCGSAYAKDYAKLKNKRIIELE